MEGTVARHNLVVSQRAMAARLVSLYKSGQTSTLEVILGARSLDDMMSRLAAAKSVTSLDANVVAQVRHFRAALQREQAPARAARRQQQSVLVVSLAAAEAGDRRADRGRTRSSRRCASEIAHLQAEQAGPRS